MEISREKLAWAAGLFEGEGCFYINEKGKYVNATVTSTDKDVLDAFLQVIGFGKIYGPVLPPENKSHWKPKWTWRCNSFEEVQALAALFWPWLKSRRRRTAKKILLIHLKNIPQSVFLSRERKQLIITRLNQISDNPLWGRRWRHGCITQKDIAKEFCVSPSLITQIKKEMAGY